MNILSFIYRNNKYAHVNTSDDMKHKSLKLNTKLDSYHRF